MEEFKNRKIENQKWENRKNEYEKDLQVEFNVKK